MTATLQMLLDEGIGLRCECVPCSRSWVLDAKPMAGSLGGDYPVPLIATLVVCEKCNGTEIEVQPDWPSKSSGMIVRPVP